MKIKKSGLVLASAAAALLASGFVSSAEQAKASAHQNGKVKCEGANACKGKSECKSKSNSCKGQNSCKGKGWMHMQSAEECTKSGGSVMKD